MTKRFVIIVLVAGGIAAGAAWATWGRRPAGLVLHEWPRGGTWAWTFPAPPDGGGDGIAVRFRVRAMPSSPPSPPVLEFPNKPMSRAEADRSFDTATISWPATADRPATGNVMVQLLDLAKVGAASDRAGQKLLVLVNLRVGGTSTWLSGDDVYLPAGRIAGHQVRGQGEGWVAGELYLMTFWVEGEGKLFRYDVLLDTGPDGPPSRPPP